MLTTLHLKNLNGIYCKIQTNDEIVTSELVSRFSLCNVVKYENNMNIGPKFLW